jgi:hypothetical protein
MPRTLKTLLAKLKRRRKSQAGPHCARNGVHDDRSGKQGLLITEGMASLTVADQPPNTTPAECEGTKMVKFGTSHDFDFTFTLDSVTKWPGPQYDKASLFAPGVFDKARPVRPKVKAKTSKRKLSQEGGQLTLRPKEPPSTKAIRDLPQSKKNPRPIHYYGSPPVRDPPHHLLNLPGEIRNQIYRAVCVSSEPIVAQFRPIIKPKRGRGSRAKLFETTKRFPREPALAIVSRQLMREVLSIFYSENTFIFRRSDDERFKDLIMTHARMMRKWTPRNQLVDSLRSIEVHFTVHPMTGAKQMIVYTFRRFADGSLQVSSNTPEVAVDCCTCFDQNVIVALKRALERGGTGLNLLTEAAKLPVFRLERFKLDTTMFVSTEGQMYRPKRLTCDECGLTTLRALQTGF